jgi:hypothetical protein
MSLLKSLQSGEPLSDDLSPEQLLFLESVRHLLRAALDGRIPFVLAMTSLLVDLRELRNADWELRAVVGQDAQSKVAYANKVAGDRGRVQPCTWERELMEDFDGLIDYSIKNGIGFFSLVSVLAHDTSALANYEWNPEKAKADFFVPRAVGWSKRNHAPIGDAEDSAG